MPADLAPLTLRRRRMIMEPGHRLLPAAGTMSTIRRSAMWLDFSGMSPNDILTTPLMSMPIPMGTRIPANRRRWPGVRPQAMWHPLMWLPLRLSRRRTWRDRKTGKVVQESYHDWSVRVALELEQSAVLSVEGQGIVRTYGRGRHLLRAATPEDRHLVPIYDPATGTWLDVLATVGIDIDSREGLAKVAAWLDGYQVPELDQLDLDHFLIAQGRDRDWTDSYLARPSAGTNPTTLVQELKAVAAYQAAKEITGLVHQQVFPLGGRLPFPASRDQLVSLTWLARTAIGSMGMDPPGALWTTQQLSIESRRAQSDYAVDALGRELLALMNGVGTRTAGAMSALQSRYQLEHEEILTQVGRMSSGQGGLRGLLRRLGA